MGWEVKLFSSCLTGNGNENVSDLLAYLPWHCYLSLLKWLSCLSQP